MATSSAPESSASSAAAGGQYHLDPAKDKIDSIVQHFQRHEFQAGVAELKALEDIDNHGRGEVWNRHIAVINGSV